MDTKTNILIEALEVGEGPEYLAYRGMHIPSSII